ncbi:MAG TPA: hydroxylamine reductase [Polyangiaceae bacterium]|nr:hydroxylamine reductase [Polyangiaceae bacterium]
MFCYQCEQTARGESQGCSSRVGNCGKTSETSDLQDLLIYAVKGIAQYDLRARQLGAGDNRAGAFILYAMFTTLTNVNFDSARFVTLLREAQATLDRVRTRYHQACLQQGVQAEVLTGPAALQLPEQASELLQVACLGAVQVGLHKVGEDVVGLRALVLYGCKGVCAYAHHALMLGQQSEGVYSGIEQALDFLASDPENVEALLKQALDLGSLNLKVMALLDAGNTGRFGTPTPTQVRVTPIPGKAILVSGHDLADLEALLKQTAGTGIHVYTHGEMLPAHSYPELKKYPHLVGNYGGAWQDQQREFASFPGPILMTSNCIIEPAPTYKRRIFTTGPVGYPGVKHLAEHDFGVLIQAAKAMPGFMVDGPEQHITIGFGRDAVMGVAGDVIAAVKSGAIKHFFLVGGCDGAAPGRNYYSEFVASTPKDSVVLTLGCAKYRFNRVDWGSIGGIPRLLDVGQCNDSYSAIQIASALAGAFGCSVNDLPLSLVVSWFEQKAAAVLLSLLALGIRKIRLGPTLPAFLTPAVLDRLVSDFQIQPVTSPEADLARSLAN